VNDTGVAMGRMLIAIMDNYQQPDGSVKVPPVLRGYMGRDVLAPKQQATSNRPGDRRSASD
jgi:seryl-tRNA synthetase